MSKGFIYDELRCVDCKACMAACILENGWDFQPRHIYKSEIIAGNALIIRNLSMACNHCENPACLSGCPSGAYSRDISSGSVVINEKKCLGCNYCKWNCPYDAPKTDPVTGLIGKCNLCKAALNNGFLPACASACPTGALNYNIITGIPGYSVPELFPGKNLDPKIRFKEKDKMHSLKIVPEKYFRAESEVETNEIKSASGEWSLIAFSFLTIWSVGLLASSLLSGKLPDPVLFFSLIAASGLFSLFHLKNKFLAWRAVTNIIHSPLSREIAAWIFYCVTSAAALYSEYPALILTASVTGLILLLVIDTVYTNSDKRIRFILNGGQAFMTGLLMVSFFSGLKVPFIFIALIKIASSISTIVFDYKVLKMPVLRFVRLVLLLITGVCLITGISYNDIALSFIFMSGELADRILYYYDFEPVSINSVYNKQNN